MAGTMKEVESVFGEASGNLSRIFTSLPSNAVSNHRRSAQALLALASPSAQVTYEVIIGVI
jgi:hypothetical protein